MKEDFEKLGLEVTIVVPWRRFDRPRWAENLGQGKLWDLGGGFEPISRRMKNVLFFPVGAANPWIP